VPHQRLAAIAALTRRAPLVAAAAVVLLFCAFAVSSMAFLHQRFVPAVQASSTRGQERVPLPAASAASIVAPVSPAAGLSRRLPAEASLTILVGSYPVGDATTAADVAAMTGWLESSGFRVYYAEVDFGHNGRWQRVLAGAYTDPQAARRDEERLKAAAPHNNVHLMSAGIATGTVAAVSRQPDPDARPSGS
jgi:hypothetical protein